jgi:hypothetical protein
MKAKRTVVGSVIKSNDKSRPNYIKFNLRNSGGVLTLKDGQTLSVESKNYQLESLEKAVSAGKLSEEIGEKIRTRIEKIPDFVLGEVILIDKGS